MTSLSLKSISAAFLLATLGVVGCGGTTGSGGTADASTTGDASTVDTGGGQDAAVGPAMTYDYVITGITVDQGLNAAGMPNGMAPDTARHTQGVAGFNLDGRFSGPMGPAAEDCAHGDYFSTTDPDQNMGTCTAGMARGGAMCTGGVDNQLPAIAETVSGFGTDIRMTLRDQVSQGKIAILIRVSDVNGTPGPTLNDSSVQVKVYPVGHPNFASCSNIGMAGQRYVVNTRSLMMGSTSLDNSLVSFNGRIENGRLKLMPPAGATMPNFTFNLPIMNMNIPLSLYQTQLRVTLGPDMGTAGALGGYVPLRDLSSMLATLLPAGIPPSTVQTVLMSLVDVQVPMGNAMGCTAPNGGISLGLGFTVSRAVIDPMPVSAAPMGMCGSM